MDATMKLSLVVSVIVLLVGVSCTRVPQEDQGPPSGESRGTDGNTPATVPSAESSAPIPESPTPNDVSATVATDSYQQSIRDPVALYFRTEMDLNSGDVRGLISISDEPPRYGIYETNLSREVRRLGIRIPEKRQWLRIDGSGYYGGVYIDNPYSDLPPDTREVLRLLDEVNASDEERRDVLERLMTSLRTEGFVAIDKVRMLMWEIRDRYGLTGPSLPDFGDRLRLLSSEQE